MKTFMGKRFAIVLMAVMGVAHLSGLAAPRSIVDSITVFSSFWAFDAGSSSVTLFRADGTYQVLENRIVTIVGPSAPLPPSHGTYTWEEVPGEPNEFILTMVDSVSLQGTPQHFVFTNDVSGNIAPTGGNVVPLSNTFSISPRSPVTGATNMSTRAWAVAGHPVITGLVIEGSTSRWVLLRGAGPALAKFGVQNTAANPGITLFKGSSNRGSFGSWSNVDGLVPGLKAIFASVGAFAFDDGSADSAALVQLAPGAYTVHCSPGTKDGELLVEAYVLPYGN